MFSKEDVIFAYTRKQAIADGVLFDVSEHATKLGFRFPVAVTAAVFSACVRDRNDPEYEAERRQVLLKELYDAIRNGEARGAEVKFWLYAVTGNGEERMDLRAVCGPDDDGAPCVTVMFENED